MSTGLAAEDWQRLPLHTIAIATLQLGLHDISADWILRYLEQRDDTPIWVDADGRIHDGRHRTLAALLDGRTHLRAHVSDRPEQS